MQDENDNPHTSEYGIEGEINISTFKLACHSITLILCDFDTILINVGSIIGGNGIFL